MPDIEGRLEHGDRVLIIDDLITSGGSIEATARLLEKAGLVVKDAIVLVDRGQGGPARMRHLGINVMSILRLETMLNMYMSHHYITEDLYRQCVDYLEANQAATGLA